MKTHLLHILFLIIVSVNSLFSQTNVRAIFSLDACDKFETETNKEAITRQNGLTITLKDFIFPEINDGDYLVLLKVSMLSYETNDSKPKVKAVSSILFKDVIKKIKSIEDSLLPASEVKFIEYTLSNKTIGSNYILKDVTNVRIEVRLVKLKNNASSILSILSPLLNIPLTDPKITDIVESLLQLISPKEDKNELVYQTELYIPTNVFEYKKLKDEGKIPLVENNEDIAILAEGEYKLNDKSITVKAKSAINATTKFFTGKEKYDIETATFSGLVRLVLSKDPIATLPNLLEKKMHELDQLLNGLNPIIESKKIESLTEKISELNNFYRESEGITEMIHFNVEQYLSLSKLYFSYLNKHSVDLKNYERWYYLNDAKGPNFSIDAYGIEGIYKKGKLAKVYIPLGLSDNLIISMYMWQSELNLWLSSKNQLSLSR